MAEKEYKKADSTTFTMKPYDHQKGGAQKIFWICEHDGEEFTNNEEYAHAAKKHESSTVLFRQASAI